MSSTSPSTTPDDSYGASAIQVLEGLEACFAGAAVTLQETDYADACPIATVALEVASTSPWLSTA